MNAIKLENTLLTVKEVSKILKINNEYVYQLIRKGDLKALKLGRWKVPYFELDRFLRDNLGREFEWGEDNDNK